MAGLLDPYADAVKGFEGYTPQANWDYKQFTNGYGTRAQAPNESITPEIANQRFQGEWQNANQSVNGFAQNLPAGWEPALTSLTYNAGAGWQNSGLGKAIKSGDYDTAKTLFAKYNQAGGAYSPGLANRRAQELSWVNGQPPGSSPPQAQGQPTAMPSPSDSSTQNAPGLFGNPLFQMGASIFNQAYQPGGNIGAGISGGIQNLQNYNKERLGQAQTQRELLRQQQTDQFANQLRTNPPAWFTKLPPEVQGLIANLPPDQAMQAATKYIGNRADLDLQGQQQRQTLGIQQDYALQLQKAKQQQLQDWIAHLQQPQQQGAPPQIPGLNAVTGGAPAQPPPQRYQWTPN